MTTLILRVEPSPIGKYFHLLPGGKTINEMLDFVRGVPMTAKTHGRIAVGGIPIPKTWWDRVRVKPDQIISVTVEPHGGGGGGVKDIVGTVATVALLAGAAFISGGALAPFLGAAFAAGGLGATLAALGVTVAGQLALNALAPPPIAPNVDSGAANQAREIAGVTGNPLSRRDYVPRIMGTMRASPPHLMFPYTELINGEVVANALVGLAGSHDISDVWISGTPIEDLDGVVSQARIGEIDDDLITLFDGGSAVVQGVDVPGRARKF